MNGTDLGRVDEICFSWANYKTKTDRRKISNEISSVVVIMNQLKHVLPHSTLKLMYDSSMNSHLQFGTTVWGYQCNRVTKLQRRAVRILFGSKCNAHTGPLSKGGNILNIEDIFKLSCLILYHKYGNRKLLNFINDIFTINADIHSYETRNRDRLYYFSYNRESVSKRIRHSMPTLINLLPEDVRLKLTRWI